MQDRPRQVSGNSNAEPAAGAFLLLLVAYPAASTTHHESSLLCDRIWDFSFDVCQQEPGLHYSFNSMMKHGSKGFKCWRVTLSQCCWWQHPLPVAIHLFMPHVWCILPSTVLRWLNIREQKWCIELKPLLSLLMHLNPPVPSAEIENSSWQIRYLPQSKRWDSKKLMHLLLDFSIRKVKKLVNIMKILINPV